MYKFARLTLPVLVLGLAVGLLRNGGRLRGDDQAPSPPSQPAVGQLPASADAAPTGHSEAAARLLHEARQRLFNHASVQAEIREFVVLGDRRFEAVGRYIAGPFNPLPQLRLEYQVRVGNTEGTLLEVCDGQILRSQRTLRRLDRKPEASEAEETSGDRKPPRANSDEISVTRRDVRKILEAVQKNGPTPETILQAELGIGGLPALLTSIERAMQFDSVQEEPLGGRPCHVLHGRWKPEFLAELQRHFAPFRDSVAAYIPDSVRIHLDTERLFPVRITYWPAPAEGVAPAPMLTLEFTNVRFDESIDPALFEFVPGGAEESDITGDYIEAIKAAVRANLPTPGR